MRRLCAERAWRLTRHATPNEAADARRRAPPAPSARARQRPTERHRRRLLLSTGKRHRGEPGHTRLTAKVTGHTGTRITQREPHNHPDPHHQRTRYWAQTCHRYNLPRYIALCSVQPNLYIARQQRALIVGGPRTRRKFCRIFLCARVQVPDNGPFSVDRRYARRVANIDPVPVER